MFEFRLVLKDGTLRESNVATWEIPFKSSGSNANIVHNYQMVGKLNS